MLRDRVITALILAPLLLALLLWGPHTWVVTVISAAMLIGAWEWAQFCGWSRAGARVGYLLVVAIAIFLAAKFAVSPAAVSNVLMAAVLWWCVAFVWIMVAPTSVTRFAAGTAGILVLTSTWVSLTSLHGAPRGAMLLLFLLLLVVAADVGAYFAGRAFGRLKLAPRVSPGKTWEGVVGGMASAGIVAVAGAYWLKLPAVPFFALCAAVAVASVVGDLTESMFKRSVGLKDSGALLPGHGGILDRIDSISAAAPVYTLGLMWFGAL